jgi:hypothetical protein
MEDKLITDNALIGRYAESVSYTHLSKTPIKPTHLIKSHPQMYAMGFNIGGRPDGLWFSRGSSWLKVAHEINNPRFPVCCYLYEVEFDSTRTDNVIQISTLDDFEKFDNDFPSYWINFDYFEVQFTDYLTGTRVSRPKLHNLEIDKLRKHGNFKETLLGNNIIFDTVEAAADSCEFYRDVNISPERFKYKDWNVISKTHSGIIFDIWDIENPALMKYLWYQSLDTISGCIWDTSVISEMKLLCEKVRSGFWNQII